MSEPKFDKFNVPEQILDKLYELTGGANAYKGMIIAYSTEKGQPVVYTKCDTQVTEYALRKALESFLTEVPEDVVEIDD
jgi:hypothetical protein